MGLPPNHPGNMDDHDLVLKPMVNLGILQFIRNLRIYIYNWIIILEDKHVYIYIYVYPEISV